MRAGRSLLTALVVLGSPSLPALSISATSVHCSLVRYLATEGVEEWIADCPDEGDCDVSRLRPGDGGRKQKRASRKAVVAVLDRFLKVAPHQDPKPGEDPTPAPAPAGTLLSWTVRSGVTLSQGHIAGPGAPPSKERTRLLKALGTLESALNRLMDSKRR